MTDLLFFGIQGSGKGTQGKIAAQKFDLQVFETGAALRAIAAEDSQLGRKVKSIIEAGNLVTNEIVMQVVADFLDKADQHTPVLFDGIPRSLEQKATFDALLARKGRQALGILIDISEEEAQRRLLGRLICSDCKAVYAADYSEINCSECQGSLTKRSDDNEEAILKRIANFKTETIPVIEEYAEADQLIKINGEQSIEKVAAEIENILTDLRKKG